MYFCVCVCVSASAQMFVHCQKHCTSCCKLLKPAALGWIRISQEAGRSSLVLSWPTNGFVDLIMVTDPSAKRSGGLLIQIKCFPHLWSFIRRLMMVTDVCVCVCSEYNRKVPSVLLITYVLLDLWGTRVKWSYAQTFNKARYDNSHKLTVFSSRFVEHNVCFLLNSSFSVLSHSTT